MNQYFSSDKHYNNVQYSLKILGITYIILGSIRVLLKMKIKNSIILQHPQFEILGALSLSAFTLSRLNSKEQREFDKLQLKQIHQRQQIDNLKQNVQDYKENVQLWTNSQFWH